MKDLPYIDDPETLARELQKLATARKARTTPARGKGPDRATRAQIHAKTDGRCHFCGCNVSADAFEADHVKNHASGGGSGAENFLPACKTCNNYRWHYSHEELQWILKIGVWVRHNIVKRTKLGSLIASAFITKEVARERRRKVPRKAKRRR